MSDGMWAAFIVFVVLLFVGGIGWLIYDDTTSRRDCFRKGGFYSEKLGCIKNWEIVP